MPVDAAVTGGVPVVDTAAARTAAAVVAAAARIAAAHIAAAVAGRRAAGPEACLEFQANFENGCARIRAHARRLLARAGAPAFLRLADNAPADGVCTRA